MELSAGNFSYLDSSVQASFEIVSDGELNIGKAAMTISRMNIITVKINGMVS